MNMKLPKCLRDDDGPGIPASTVEVDFSEYLWMGEEMEEFDRQVEEELWEEAFIEACFEEMLEEEESQWQYFSSQSVSSCQSRPLDTVPSQNISTLNPEAPEFIPQTSWQKA